MWIPATLPAVSSQRSVPRHALALRALAPSRRSARAPARWRQAAARRPFGESQKGHLVSVVADGEATTVAQANLDCDPKANATTALRLLLATLDRSLVIVTADALHTQPEHEGSLFGLGAHYIFGAKKNQPQLLACCAPSCRSPPDTSSVPFP